MRKLEPDDIDNCVNHDIEQGTESVPFKSSDRKVVIIGAGPAGLTAAYELSKHKVSSVVLERFHSYCRPYPQ